METEAQVGSSSRSRGGETRAAQISEQIKADILRGVLRPGSWLRLEDLRASFGVSWSPLRESLSSLVASGLVVTDGRSYHVAPISRAELVDVLDLRLSLESKALRAAIARGDDAWERGLVATHHQLSKLETLRWQPDQLAQWEEWHQRYHHALISGSGAPVLVPLCHHLHEISDRYRRLYFSVHPRDRDIAAEHADILQAALARDADAACQMMERHIKRTLEFILDAMPEDIDIQTPRPRG